MSSGFLSKAIYIGPIMFALGLTVKEYVNSMRVSKLVEWRVTQNPHAALAGDTLFVALIHCKSITL